MINNLSVVNAQLLAEALVQHLIEEAGSLDPASLSEVLQAGLQVDEVQDLVAALLGFDTEELSNWVEETLEEPDWDPEY